MTLLALFNAESLLRRAFGFAAKQLCATCTGRPSRPSRFRQEFFVPFRVMKLGRGLQWVRITDLTNPGPHTPQGVHISTGSVRRKRNLAMHYVTNELGRPNQRDARNSRKSRTLHQGTPGGVPMFVGRREWEIEVTLCGAHFSFVTSRVYSASRISQCKWHPGMFVFNNSLLRAVFTGKYDWEEHDMRPIAPLHNIVCAILLAKHLWHTS